MAIKLKRIFLLFVGVLVTLLGISSTVSALLGYYTDHLGLIAAIGVCGALLVALGAFLARLAIRGTDREVSETDVF